MFHVYDIIMMFLKMATGIVTALVRFVLAMVIALFTLPRMDASPLPGWVERYLLLDAGSQSYHAMILLHHRHSNPVMNIAVQVWTLAAFHRDECLEGRAHFLPRFSLVMGGSDTDTVCDAQPVPDTEAWTQDKRYRAGHMLYQDLANQNRATQAVAVEGANEQFKMYSPGKTRVMNKWRLAIMLLRLPWLREFRVQEAHHDDFEALEVEIKDAKKKHGSKRGKMDKDEEKSSPESKTGDGVEDGVELATLKRPVSVVLGGSIAVVSELSHNPANAAATANGAVTVLVGHALHAAESEVAV